MNFLKQLFLFIFFAVYFFTGNTSFVKSEPYFKDNGKKHSVIIGKISVTDENYIYLINNWKSRSKKTYRILNGLPDEYKKLDGKIIEVECDILKKRDWTGEINVKSYRIINQEDKEFYGSDEAENLNKPLIQIALLLDTSNSMDGLIDQAKSQLWKIVNELASAKKYGISPELNVSLFEYGKNSLESEEGFIRMVSQFTTDLDLISDELFKLKTNGGNEYCGWVIRSAVESLNWSASPEDLKLIFIAGNEPFNQAQNIVDFRKSCKAAIKKSIIVNTIFCGNYDEGVRTYWKEGADIADGKYINIDHNQIIVAVSAPQDTEIIKLNNELNLTYIGYGRTGESKKLNQLKQDYNAMSVNSEIAVQRASVKSKSVYKNEDWDLVDAYETDEEILHTMKEEEVPEELKKMNFEERKKYLDNLKKKRALIQHKINQLSKEREKYAADHIQNLSSKNTLDSAIIKTISEIARLKKFEITY
ncbi:VWA domain-containing protein [Candidatus Dependentiae bacterium]|nr:VWA domain-containing protein [Candidatus Dependentiae bacterium]